MILVDVVSNKEDWSNALIRFDSWDFYHTWDFHEISARNGEGKPVLFKVSLGDEQLIFPLLSRNILGTQYKDLTSVYGYPSFLYTGTCPETFNKLWHALLNYLESKGYVSLFSRLNPLLAYDAISEQIAKPVGNVVYIDLQRSESEQLQAYRSNHRRDIRKLERMGVQCQASEGVGESFDAFIANYNVTMDKLAADEYYFFSREYYKQLLNANNFTAKIYSCYLEGEIIASGIFTFCGDFVQYHLGGTHPDYVRLAPTKIMFDQVRKDATHLGFKKFSLGSGLGFRDDGLFNFKKGFSDSTAAFGVINAVINKKIYSELSRGIESDTGFFPLYRAVTAEEVLATAL
ncbi:MAG: GNAT family N-acetyltransferase [Aeromonadales bacterium]|nr:GNAT family N-acetyltransferase [Aeromonadales bacterium]